ncbi:MAG: cytochrome c [Candidatus Rokubacteria bacterium]|nr:cytochrome c [Candidatus Rokubacteria bacterium]MBI2553493.1 cytochrome c [Candidatus Rokubacteria bacterium]
MVLLAAAAAAQSAKDQIAQGRALFEHHCGRCHRPGGDGPELTRDALAPKGTALGLFDFVRANMPHDAPGTLKEQEYWDIVAHVLAAAGVVRAGPPVGPDTAAGIRLPE